MAFTRIVVLTFQTGKGQEFLARFEGWKSQIASFPGCISLQLVQDTKDIDRFMTISQWKDAQDLENYRKSAVFKGVWPIVKPMFRDQAQAWSVKTRWSSDT